MSWVHRERERDESSGGVGDRGTVGRDEELTVEGKRVERWGAVAVRIASRLGRLEKSSKG